MMVAIIERDGIGEVNKELTLGEVNKELPEEMTFKLSRLRSEG